MGYFFIHTQNLLQIAIDFLTSKYWVHRVKLVHMNYSRGCFLIIILFVCVCVCVCVCVFVCVAF